MTTQITQDALDALVASVKAQFTVTTTPPPDPTPTPTGPWLSGAYTQHSASTFSAMSKWRGKPLEIAGVFATYDMAVNDIGNTWYLGSNVVPVGVPVALGMPMCVKGGVVSQDLSVQMLAAAKAIKARGVVTYVRLGWEMNIDQPWKVTDANLVTWRSRWATYYDVFKSTAGVLAQVGFNGNIGPNQSGLSGSLEKAMVVGCVDWVGPDAYDCWPPFNSDANVKQQHLATQGLDWWADLAKRWNVPLCLPEWGGSAGTQWAGHSGGDNPRYPTEIKKWLSAQPSVGFDCYFNEPQSYVDSAVYPITRMPNLAAAYKSSFSS